MNSITPCIKIEKYKLDFNGKSYTFEAPKGAKYLYMDDRADFVWVCVSTDVNPFDIMTYKIHIMRDNFLIGKSAFEKHKYIKTILDKKHSAYHLFIDENLF